MKKRILIVLSVLFVLTWAVIFVSSLNGSVGSYPVTTVLASIAGNYKYVIGFIGGVPKAYFADYPQASELKNMSPAYGYWVYVNKTGGINLTINGTIISNVTFELKQGWNLIGFPSSNQSKSVQDALGSIAGSYKYVIGFIGGVPKAYFADYPQASELKNMSWGYGYWIYINKTGGVNLTIQ